MRQLLPLFQKPSRYLGSEWGSVRKDPATVAVRLALAFPDLYEVGMSYLGQKILYDVVNGRPEFWAERVYAPAEDAIALLRQHHLPLASLESDTPLGELDCLAFHLTHELCFTNVLLILDLAGLPLRSAGRSEDHPLVIAGGGAAVNAEPLAPCVDLMLLGEGEESLPRLLELVADHKAAGGSRQALLEAARHLPGVYVPAFFRPSPTGLPLEPIFEDYPRAAKTVVADLDQTSFPTAQLVPYGQAVHDRLTLEIARGCTRGCRFCHAGMVYRPVRERRPETVVRLLQEGLAATGYEEVSFLSLSTGDYSALEGLFAGSMERCLAEQVAISLPSLRVGSVSGRLYQLMSRIRRTGVTIAPEAGSQRLRDVINKGVTEEGLLAHVRSLFERGWSQVKLYFMIGLPTETDEDLRAIFDLCCRVLAQAPRGTRRLQVTASVAIFVPKPHTPFQWEAQIPMAEARRRIDLLRDLFRTNGKLTLRWHEPRMSLLEGVFARAGRGLAGVVEGAYRRGLLFTAWEDRLDLDGWLEVLASEGIDADGCLAERPQDAPLPWDHLDVGVSREFLLTERSRAFSGKATADCRFDACRGCGVCGLEGRPTSLPQGPQLRPVVVHGQRDQEEAGDEAPVHQPQRPPDLAAELGFKAGHYRLWFTKTGPARFLSTLELQSVFERVLRRAAIQTSFSKGFHPMPLLSFGQALPVGVASRAEWINIFTRRTYPLPELHQRLAPQLPEGLALTRVEALGLGKRQPQPVAEEFELVYTGSGHGLPAWREAWERFAAAATWPFVRTTAKGSRELDARAYVTRVSFPDPRCVALGCDWSPDNRGYVSPLALVQAVTPELPATDFLLTKISQTLA